MKTTITCYWTLRVRPLIDFLPDYNKQYEVKRTIDHFISKSWQSFLMKTKGFKRILKECKVMIRYLNNEINDLLNSKKDSIDVITISYIKDMSMMLHNHKKSLYYRMLTLYLKSKQNDIYHVLSIIGMVCAALIYIIVVLYIITLI